MRKMIRKITYGTPFDTEAVTGVFEEWAGELPYFYTGGRKKILLYHGRRGYCIWPWGKRERNQ